MKIVIDHGPALKAMARVQAAAASGNKIIPILHNVLLKADFGRLTFICTNLDMECRDTIDCTISEPGEVTTNAKALYDMLRAFPTGSEIELSQSATAKEARLIVKCARSTFRAATCPAGDFPAMPRDGFGAVIRMASKDLMGILDRTLFSVGSEATRYYLCGAFLHMLDGELASAATDGHRLALCKAPLLEVEGEWKGVIIPTGALVQIRKLLETAGPEATLRLSESKLIAELGTAELVTKLLDGNFPDYNRVIPQRNEHVATIDPRALEGAIKRMAVAATDKHGSVAFEFQPGSVRLKCHNDQGGEADETLPIEYSGPDIRIGFNSKNLLQAAQQIAGPAARFALLDAGSPTLLTDPLDSRSSFVVMPLRV
jgi:DNA polymerase-3 subunit beta